MKENKWISESINESINESVNQSISLSPFPPWAKFYRTKNVNLKENGNDYIIIDNMIDKSDFELTTRKNRKTNRYMLWSEGTSLSLYNLG